LKFVRSTWSLVKETFSEWSAAKAPRLGAALSYYTVFSLAPVLLVVIAVAGFFLGPEAAQGRLTEQLTGLLGQDAASVVQGMLAKAGERKAGIIATAIGLATLLAGATGVMLELQGALNTVWEVVPKPGRGIKGILKDRALGLALVISIGFLLLVSLVLSAALAAFSGLLESIMPGAVVLGYVLNNAVSIFVIGAFFALLFKALPDAKIAWRDVWVGSLVTSFMFHIGKFAIGLYLGKASVGSAFGAAGSLAILLIWIYYSSQIVLLGAEFTRVYANRYGSRVVPDANALPAPSGPELRIALDKKLKQDERNKRQDGKGERASAQPD
jgi:membrane protein